jgi:hypothetical protein
MATTESPARELAPLYLTVGAMVALTPLGALVGESLGFGFIFLEPALFGLICLVGCAVAPTHPLRVAVLGVIGAILGIGLDLTISPTVDGYERNLWPLEIAYHAVVATVIFPLAALAWKVVFMLRARGKAHA